MTHLRYLLLTVFSLAAANAQTYPPSSFVTCISGSGSGNCTLTGGPYDVDSSHVLVVGRSNFTISGDAPGLTTLRRYSTYGNGGGVHSELLTVSAVSNVTIENFFFDGNRGSVTCTNSVNCAEVYIEQSGSGSASYDTVQGNIFQNAPGIPLMIWGNGGGNTLDHATVTSNLFLEANGGVLIGGENTFYNSSTQQGDQTFDTSGIGCYADSVYSASGNSGIPTQLTVSANYFRGHAVGLLAINEAYGGTVTGNTIVTSSSDAGGGTGGAVYAPPCDSYITISSNFLDSTSLETDSSSQGLELYASNLTVTNNVIQNYGGQGIYLGGANTTGSNINSGEQNVITNTDIAQLGSCTSSSSSTCDGAIMFNNLTQNTGCSTGDPQCFLYRANANFNIENNVTDNSHWAGLFFQAPDTFNISTHTDVGAPTNPLMADMYITNNCLENDSPVNSTPMRATSFTHGSVTFSAGYVTPSTYSNSCPVSVSGSMPVTSASPSGGSGSSQTFTFTATDVSGYSDVSVIAVAIETSQIVSAPAYACHLEYYPSNNYLYLNDDAGDYNFTGREAPVGSGGSTISNSQCSINTASGSVSSSGRTLSVTVPITFASGWTAQKYIYGTSLNAALNYLPWATMGEWGI
jgi:hypothetical protein